MTDVGHQAELLSMEATSHAYRGEVELPVARVHVIMPLPHMDRIFDYEIPASFDERVQVGVLVRVPVGTQKVNGYVVFRTGSTSMPGRLKAISRVVSTLPLLTPEIYSLARVVAARQAGSVADVLRLAIPARHARVEKEFCAQDPVAADIVPKMSQRQRELWRSYVGGWAFLSRLSAGESPRAVCCSLPGIEGAIDQIAGSCVAVLESGRSVIIVVPTARRAVHLAKSLERILEVEIATLISEDIQPTRYNNFLQTLSGQARIVVGTRAAAWAPVQDLGLAIVVDDASAALRESHAPYYEAREVLAQRAEVDSCGFLIFSPYISEPAAAMVDSGWAALLQGSEQAKQNSIVQVSHPGLWNHEDTPWSRIPSSAFVLMRAKLENGPILVVVPRAGYIPFIACGNCQTSATCSECGGALGLTQANNPPTCSRCGKIYRSWKCSECGSGTIRSVRIGSHRTAEEIGKAFPGVGIIVSGANSPDGIAQNVSRKPRIVVATPGSEPVADGGFAGALVLDSRFLVGHGLGAETEFLRRAARIITRVRPKRAGGHVLFTGGADPRMLRVLDTWNMDAMAQELLGERRELELPPMNRWFAVHGQLSNIRWLLGAIRAELLGGAKQADFMAPTSAKQPESLLVGGTHEFVPGVQLLGPHQSGAENTVYLRTALSNAGNLARAVRRAHREYTAKQIGKSIRIEADPRM